MGFRKSKFCLLIILTILLVNIASSQEIRFTGKQNTILDIFEECEDRGFPCQADYNCNLTVRDPNQTILVSNQLMSRNDTLYNFTLGEGETKVIGTYEDTVCCANASNGGCSHFFHEITPSGSKPISSGEGSSLIGILATLIFAIIFFLVLGIFAKNIPFKIFFVGLSILLMIGTLGFGVTVMQQLFGAFTQIISSYGMFFRLLTILSGGAIVGLILYLVVVALRTFKIKRGLIE